jgi:hypothetical protein
VRGAIVRAEPEDGWPMVRAGETVRPESSSDAQGFFCVRGLMDGRFSLEVTSQLFVPARLGPLSTDNDAVEVFLDAGLRVGGQVRCNGRPVAGAKITAVKWDGEGAAFALWRASLAQHPRHHEQSADDGTFELRGIPRAGHRLLIEALDCALWVSPPLRGSDGERLDLGTIALPPAAVVEGTAEPHATVSLDGVSDAGLTRSTHADDKGRFAFRNLPAGEYTVIYHSLARPAAGGRIAPPERRISLRAGDHVSISFTP